MNQVDLDNIILLALKIAGIVTLVFNIGIALVLGRQMITMNNVVRVKNGILMLSIVFVFIMLAIVSLLFVAFI